jgi:hypothetical protein
MQRLVGELSCKEVMTVPSCMRSALLRMQSSCPATLPIVWAWALQEKKRKSAAADEPKKEVAAPVQAAVEEPKSEKKKKKKKDK